MNPDPQSPAPNSIRKIQIANVVLWIVAGLITFVAPAFLSSPVKGRFIYMMSFLLLTFGSVQMVSAAYRAGGGKR